MIQSSIGIVGLGLLGRGIAACLVANGFNVIGVDSNADQRASAARYVEEAMQDLVRHGCADESLLKQWKDRLQITSDIPSLHPCGFVIESVPEDLQLKRTVYGEIEKAVGASVPIASNSSAIRISDLQQDRAHPNRFIGMHWAAPCHISRFLEVIRGELTDDATVAATMSLGKSAGKETCLVNRDIDGFIVNRIGYAMFREAFHLLESGVADVETIDSAFRNAIGLWAPIAGPFRWMDLTGLASYAPAMQRLFPQLSNSTSLPETMRKLVASGARGSVNGQGFYQYTTAETARWETTLIDNAWRVRGHGGLKSSEDASCG